MWVGEEWGSGELVVRCIQPLVEGGFDREGEGQRALLVAFSADDDGIATDIGAGEGERFTDAQAEAVEGEEEREVATGFLRGRM